MKIVTVLPLYGHFDKKFFGKDIIQIGLTFKKIKLFECEFWCLDKSEQSFEYLGQKWISSKNFLSILIKIFKERKKITLLHVYSIRRDTLLIILIYKFFNKKGKVYVKTDIALFKNGIDSREVFKKLPQTVLRLFLSKSDYIGLESKTLKYFFESYYQEYKKKFLFIPSGSIDIPIFHGIKNKENIITLCGRLGANEKNFEIFFNMLKNNNIEIFNSWKIQLIGEMTLEFKELLNTLITLKPILKERITYLGFINNKDDLYKNLVKSKLFIITSKHEGEPNVQFDSMFCGNFMITTEVGTIKDNYPDEYCLIFKNNDGEDLYKKIKEFIIRDKNYSILDYQKIQNHCIKNFTWEKSLKPILDKF